MIKTPNLFEIQYTIIFNIFIANEVLKKLIKREN